MFSEGLKGVQATMYGWRGAEGGWLEGGMGEAIAVGSGRGDICGYPRAERV